MATTSSNFFTNGTPEQFDQVMNLYTQVLRLKAESKNKKPEELIKLDNWYQNELPKKIKARGKDAHLNHEELVQLMKWKQTRGKFYPQLNYLVKVNTPRAVMLETKKAFKKLPNLELALSALSNLKGVGTTLASALLAAATPEVAPFMADECLMAIPDIEGIDYTTKEYLKFVNFINATVERLNKESKNGESWNAHQVELALWTHYVASELKPELLEDIVGPVKSTTNGNSTHTNGSAIDTCSDESNLEPATQTDKIVSTGTAPPSEIEDTSSLQSLASEKSLDGSIGNNHTDDITNDSVMTSAEDTNDSTAPSSHEPSAPPINNLPVESGDDNASAEPPLKRTKLEPVMEEKETTEIVKDPSVATVDSSSEVKAPSTTSSEAKPEPMDTTVAEVKSVSAELPEGKLEAESEGKSEEAKIAEVESDKTVVPVVEMNGESAVSEESKEEKPVESKTE